MFLSLSWAELVCKKHSQLTRSGQTHISRLSSCSEFLARDALTLLKVSRRETGILDDPGILSGAQEREKRKENKTRKDYALKSNDDAYACACCIALNHGMT